MTLPMARDLAQHGIRVCTIARAICHATDENAARSGAGITGGQHSVSAAPGQARGLQLAAHIVSNGHLNGEVIRLDGALRMAPR